MKVGEVFKMKGSKDHFFIFYAFSGQGGGGANTEKVLSYTNNVIGNQNFIILAIWKHIYSKKVLKI